MLDDGLPVDFDDEEDDYETQLAWCAWEDAQKTDPCLWTQDETGVWETECGGMFEVMEGKPNENAMLFCTYFGHPLKESDAR